VSVLEDSVFKMFTRFLFDHLLWVWWIFRHCNIGDNGTYSPRRMTFLLPSRTSNDWRQRV